MNTAINSSVVLCPSDRLPGVENHMLPDASLMLAFPVLLIQYVHTLVLRGALSHVQSLPVLQVLPLALRPYIPAIPPLFVLLVHDPSPMLIQTPPFPVLPFALLPPSFLLLSFLPPLVPRQEPLFARGVLLHLRGVREHAGVHGLVLRPAPEGSEVGLCLGACCEF